MIARPNSSDESRDTTLSSDRSRRRIELRYYLAQLLTLEKFDEALSEALVARSNEEIFQCDLQFVVGIVRAAERMGRTRIDHERFPKDLFVSPTEPGTVAEIGNSAASSRFKT